VRALAAPEAAGTPTDAPTPTRTSTATPGWADMPTDVPAPTRIPTATPKPAQVEWRGDLHMHTTCSDGQNTYDEMVQRAIELHLDFIAITDHVGISERECHNASIVKCKAETRLLCIPGAELTARLHLLAIGFHQWNARGVRQRKINCCGSFRTGTTSPVCITVMLIISVMWVGGITCAACRSIVSRT